MGGNGRADLKCVFSPLSESSFFGRLRDAGTFCKLRNFAQNRESCCFLTLCSAASEDEGESLHVGLKNFYTWVGGKLSKVLRKPFLKQKVYLLISALTLFSDIYELDLDYLKMMNKCFEMDQ